MARRRHSRSRHLALRGAACSTTSRWLRGGLGFVVGVLGLTGSAVGAYVGVRKPEC
jgi:hypothetical protein